jgi:hypothetical protein
MKYLVVKNTAVLASRGIETVGEGGTVQMKVVGVPEGASVYLTKDGANTTSGTFSISSGTTNITGLTDVGTYKPTFSWKTSDEKEMESEGNSFTVIKDDEGALKIIPTPLSSATELEKMWQGISATLEVLLPFIDDYKNGTHVV